jgi:hypothetical protein
MRYHAGVIPQIFHRLRWFVGKRGKSRGGVPRQIDSEG